MFKQERYFWLLSSLALFCLMFLLIIPSDSKNALLLGFSGSRLVMVFVLLLAVMASTGLAISFRHDNGFSGDVRAFMSGSPRWSELGMGLVLLLLLGILLGVAFLAAWYYLPSHYDAIFLRASPLVVFATVACLGGLVVLDIYRDSLMDRIETFTSKIEEFNQRNKVYLFALLVFISVLVGVRYYRLAERHASIVNTNPDLSDQDDYLRIAEKAYETGFQYKGDRKRMPLYPNLLALFYRPGESLVDFFQQGKQVNIILSLLLLTGITLICWKLLPLAQSALLAFIAAASLFVYKAGYVQPELLYYFLSFTSYILMGWMLIRPSLWLGALTGAAAALSYLTKASLLASVALFAAMFITKLIVDLIAEHWGKRDPHGVPTSLAVKAASLGLMLVVFLGLISPYLLENKKLFGMYFYNANTTFYIWYDSIEEAMSGTWAHGDEIGWPDMPPEQIPSLRKYLREHTTAQIQERFTRGFLSQKKVLEKPYGWFNYIVIYSLVLLGFSLLFPRTCLKLIRRYWYLVLFALLYFSGYIIMISWFGATTDYRLARFTYALYLPYLFSMFLASNQIVKECKYVRIGNSSLSSSSLLWTVHTLVFVLVLYDFIFFPDQRLLGWYGK